jgi:exopolysaccharide biosynthesis polyprenyl glycosylphosphotransferase
MYVVGRLRQQRGDPSGPTDVGLEPLWPNADEQVADEEQRLLSAVDTRTRELIEARRGTHGRSWLIRRWLVAADVIALTAAFLLAVGLTQNFERSAWVALAIFAASLGIWVAAAKLLGLYDRDDRGMDYSTVDDVLHVFLLVTVGALVLSLTTGYTDSSMARVLLFWGLGVTFVLGGRAAVRALSHKSRSYVQNTVIVGAGETGQLVARKLLQHPEYGINLVGFVDAEPKARRADLRDLVVLGGLEDLPEIVRVLGVERVIIAFLREDTAKTLELVRMLKNYEVHIDIVPRLFEVVGPNVDVHTLEGLPLLGLPTPKMSPSSRMLKRGLDIVGASVALVLTAPFFLVISLAIWWDTGGPILFRQVRLGGGMKEFTILKFRTMKQGTGDAEHREAVKSGLNGDAPEGSNGLYKAEQSHAVTRAGGWLRKTRLDELPQLINILRGEMSLVGPRPSLPYEVDHFAPHHFERFLVPAGLTGLWQVTARAQTSWAEALDMDVAYVRGWSFGLDFWLLCRTPFQAYRLKTR